MLQVSAFTGLVLSILAVFAFKNQPPTAPSPNAFKTKDAEPGQFSK
jgi:hypothetical protein